MRLNVAPQEIRIMCPDDGCNRELIEIWLAANEGTASDLEIARLNAAITTDDAFRDQLLQLTQHQAWLEWNGERYSLHFARLDVVWDSGG
jgi:hypothetical protein